jgi:phage terminase large subunit GpA-like protein
MIDNVSSKAYGQSLYIVDTDQYKNLIAARLNRPIGTGCFMVHAQCDKDYAFQLTSEHKIRTRKGNRDIETWVPKTSSAANHYLDTEVYATLAADLLHVRYLEELPPPRPQPKGEDKSDEWIEVKEDWLA